jgi:hypothetical protein
MSNNHERIFGKKEKKAVKHNEDEIPLGADASVNEFTVTKPLSFVRDVLGMFRRDK